MTWVVQCHRSARTAVGSDGLGAGAQERVADTQAFATSSPQVRANSGPLNPLVIISRCPHCRRHIGPRPETELTCQAREQLEAFIAESCVREPCRQRSSDLYGVYCAWAKASSRVVLSQRAVSMALAALGFAQFKSNCIFWVGLRALAGPPAGGGLKAQPCDPPKSGTVGGQL